MSSVRGYMHRPVELDRFVPGKSYAVAASAGTGKTFLIQHLVAELVLEQGVPLRQILLVTYTEKAAGELKRRIREVLQAAASPAPNAPAGPHRVVTAAKQSLAQKALADFDLVTVGTIHQFCLASLREFGVLAGLPPLLGGQISDEPLEEAAKIELRAGLSGGPLLSLWRALSGSAREDLLEHACKVAPFPFVIRPDERALERAIVELVARWRGLESPTFPEGTQHPFHKAPNFGAKSETEAVIGYRKFSRTVFETCAAIDQGTLSPTDALAVPFALAFEQLREGRKNQALAGIYKTSNPCHSTAQREFVELAVQLCEDALAFAAVCLGRKIKDRVEALHEERGTLTYGRMVSLLARALKDEAARGATTPLHEALQRRYRVGIIDEFQDTDPHQWSIFRSLFVPGHEAGRRRDGQLFLVGDEKQAIYRFRGADLHTYRRATKELMAAAGTSEVTLDTNWRSTKELLDGLQQLLAPRLFVEDGVPFGQMKAGGGCQFVYEPGQPPVTFLCPESHDDKPLTKADLDHALAEGIAAEVVRLLGDPSPRYQGRGLDTPRRLHAGDICILGRGQRDLTLVSRALHRAGLPFSQYKREGLYTSAEAVDLLDLLLSLMQEHDGGAQSRALSTCFFAIPARELESLRALSSDHPLSLQLGRWRSLANAGAIPALFRLIEHESEVMPRLLFLEGERAAANLRQLFDQLLSLHRREKWLLPQLCRELRRRINHAQEDDKGLEHGLMQLETERKVITLMTMHTSKGLQFPVVFLAGGYRGIPDRPPSHPSPLVDDSGVPYLALRPASEESRAHYARGGAEDDARLLYVAATRAEAKLYLPHWRDERMTGQFDAKLYARIREDTTRLISLPHSLIGLLAAGSPEAILPPVPGTMSKAAEAVVRATAQPGVSGAPLEMVRRSVARATLGITSFTREHRSRSTPLSTSMADVDAPREMEPVPKEQDEPDSDDDVTVLPVAEPLSSTAEPRLPQGTAFGTMVHSALEHEDYATLRSAGDLEAWLAGHPKTLLRCRAEGFSDDVARAVCGMVYRTVTRPWPATRFEDGCCVSSSMPPFAALEEVLFEAPFLLPVPEENHPPLAVGDGEPERIYFAPSRGWITGSIDAVVRHDGRTSLIDWKTNRLISDQDVSREDYSPSRIAAYTRAEYGLQMELYMLALLRWLGIQNERDYETRFGGVFYVYLRGAGALDAPRGQGVFHWLPAYEEVLSIVEKLVGREYVAAPLRMPSGERR
ncbi:MAG: UvrD-helicase domain-containing protein [Myxococcota bacterium]